MLILAIIVGAALHLCWSAAIKVRDARIGRGGDWRIWGALLAFVRRSGVNNARQGYLF